MGEDETSAYQLLKKNRQGLKLLIEKHNGLSRQEMGDGTMAQFGSSLDTVNCALEIQ